MLKICQICAVDFTLKKFLLPLIVSLQDAGMDVVAVCSPGPYSAELRDKGLEIKHIPIARSMNPLLAFQSIWKLATYLREQKFTVVHVHTPVAAFIGRVAAKIAGVPLVIYTAHGFYFHEGMPSWKRYSFIILEKLAGRFTDLLFCQSAEDADDARRYKFLSPDKVITIGNGVDIEKFNPDKVAAAELIKDELSLPRDALVVGFVGRLVKEKGVNEFLRVMTKIALVDKRVAVLLVGEKLGSDHDTGVEHELEKAKSILSDRLISTGLRDDIPELLQAIDIFCLPSWREGMPRTIIEAMMMETPVVATNIRGAREEVVPNETGLLVTVRDERELYDAMQRLLEDGELRSKMGIKGRQRALRKYNEKDVIKLQITRILDELKMR